MSQEAYWAQMGSEGTKIAPASKRKPITAERIAQAEADLAAAAARIRERVSA